MHINLENITYQEERETENSPKITKEIWRIVKSLLIKKTPGPEVLSVSSTKHSREKIIPMFMKDWNYFFPWVFGRTHW